MTAPGRPRTYSAHMLELSRRVARVERAGGGAPWAAGTVTAAAAGGYAAVSWATGGGPARYAAGYVPYPGDAVLLAFAGGQPVIVAGLPVAGYGYGVGPYGESPYGA